MVYWAALTPMALLHMMHFSFLHSWGFPGPLWVLIICIHRIHKFLHNADTDPRPCSSCEVAVTCQGCLGQWCTAPASRLGIFNLLRTASFMEFHGCRWLIERDLISQGRVKGGCEGSFTFSLKNSLLHFESLSFIEVHEHTASRRLLLLHLQLFFSLSCKKWSCLFSELSAVPQLLFIICHHKTPMIFVDFMHHSFTITSDLVFCIRSLNSRLSGPTKIEQTAS